MGQTRRSVLLKVMDKFAINIRIQPRDIEILRELAEMPAVMLKHLAALYFDGSRDAAYKRLGALRRAGLITSLQRHGDTGCHLFRITRPGYRVLNQSVPDLESWRCTKASQRKLSASKECHELDIMTTKVALMLAERREQHVRLESFTTNVGQHLTSVSNLSTGWRLIPDAYICLTDRVRRHHFYLEVDRSTQSHRVIQNKVLLYRQACKRNMMSARSSRETSNSSPSFRVLFVCQGSDRRDNLAGASLSLNPPVSTLAWFADISDFSNDPIGKIWVTPRAIAEMYTTNSVHPCFQALL